MKGECTASEEVSLADTDPRRCNADWEKKLSRTLVLVNLASILEKADEAVLPSVFREVGLSLHVSLTGLATISLLRKIVQTLCYPLAAYMSVHHHRGSVIALGALIWAIATFIVGASTTYVELAISRAMTGIGLAIVVPAIQSMVADAANARKRGLAFGWLLFTGNIGAMLGSVLAVLLAGTTVFGLAGWRASLHLIAAASVVIAILVYLLAVDPRFTEGSRGHTTYNSAMMSSSALVETLVGAKTVMKLPTFLAVAAQGVVGTFSWAALTFCPLWIELVGFSNSETAAILGSYILSISLGGLFGGWAGDMLARPLPNTGRIILAQFSSGFGVLASAILFLFLPYDSSTAILHGVVYFVIGFFMPWCGTAANNPIYAEIVPEKLRTSIYALDQFFESLLASFAPLLVSLLAEHVFGYDDASTEANTENAMALGRALFVMFAIPCAFCCLLYLVLYWTYPKDRDKARAELHYSNEDLNPYVSLTDEPDGDVAHLEKASNT